MASLDALRKARKFARVSFTRLCGRIDALGHDKDGIAALVKLLGEKDEQLKVLDSQIQVILMAQESSTDKEIEEEIETADGYHEKYLSIMLECERDTSSDQTKDTTQASMNSEGESWTKRGVSLPKLTLCQFDGEIKTWLPFWNSFKTVDEDACLSNIQKFQYLVQAVTPGTRAREVLDSFPLTEGNYLKAMKSLKERFGREELLIDFYVRELLKIIISNSLQPEKVKLTRLYDSIQTHIRSLATLGVTMERCAPVLYPLVESCLPGDILRIWQRHKNTVPTYAVATHETLKENLENLMQFLKSEVEQEELVVMAAQGFGLAEQANSKRKMKDNTPSLLNNSKTISKNNKCIFCDCSSHKAVDCFRAQNMNLEEKRKTISEKRACFRCLKVGHSAAHCYKKVRCTVCGRRHFTLICPEDSRNNPTRVTDSNRKQSADQVETSLLANTSSPHVYLQTVRVKLRGDNGEKEVRALFDSGSQRSYILESTAQELGYKKKADQLVSHSLFGGTVTDLQTHGVYQIRIVTLNGSYACKFDALGQAIICGEIEPVRERPSTEKLKAQGIVFSDYFEGPIEVLLGADVMAQLYTRDRHELGGGLVALRTLLGWTLMGKNSKNSSSTSSMTAVSLFNKTFSVQDLWQLEVLGIVDPGVRETQEEAHEQVKRLFKDTVSLSEEGRYVVTMPWKEGHPPLGSNLGMANRRLDKVLTKLKSDNLYDSYNTVLNEWLALGIIEEVVNPEESKSAHYLPHRAVVKESSQTTKVRPVFDASAHEKGEPCLNDCLNPGPNLIELIPSLLIRFRLERIGVVADIAKAFLQIELQESNRDHLRFLWETPEGKRVTYRHRRVVFGVCCSPYLLGMTINHHLEKMASKDKITYSVSTISRLQSSFYVDNCVTSVKDAAELSKFIREATAVMAEGLFDLRGWENSLMSFQESTTSVLGTIWDKCSDTISVSESCWQNDKITRRVILSVAQKIFDPIGFTCPTTIVPKILLQDTWSDNLKWDDEVSLEISRKFSNWGKELGSLTSVRIPRWLNFATNSRLDIHTFCDASQKAYATAIFVRVENGPDVHVHLVLAKSRVAPLKKLTIPRLELLAAVIGGRMYKTLVNSIKDLKFRSYFWSDSSTVLAWISRENEWTPFVWNRVKEIRGNTAVSDWYHVPGLLNPADFPSRGCSPRELLESKWWEGPAWLKLPENAWPLSSPDVDEEAVAAEQRKKIVTSLSNLEHHPWYARYFSRYNQCVRVVAWILRFKKNCPAPIKTRGDISPSEFAAAEVILIRMVQRDALDTSAQRKLSNFPTFVDDSGLLRVKTKVSNRPDLEDFCYPLLLPDRNPIVDRLIFQTHQKSCHAGSQTIMALLRERYWILGGLKSVRRVLTKCFICKRFNAPRLNEETPPLPVERVRDAAVFEVVGLDFAGPLHLRGSRKAWICLFTCAVYRAVHLELVSGLSTPAFFQGLRRFIARRGRPKIIFSDRGTNFIGADNAMKKLNWDQICRDTDQIKWKFNPPLSPWWGGFWERLIGMTKKLLRRLLGHASLKYEELYTILCDCESVINSRPLTHQSDDPNELQSLTPKMFIQDVVAGGVADMDEIDSSSLSRRVQYRRRLMEDLRQRFRLEYLGQLKDWSTKRSRRSVCVGDLVLVGDDQTRRMDWPLGIIEEVLPGSDQRVRLVRLRTKGGTLMRPIQRLHLLEAAEEHGEPRTVGMESTGNSVRPFEYTRSGRRVKQPSKLNL